MFLISLSTQLCVGNIEPDCFPVLGVKIMFTIQREEDIVFVLERIVIRSYFILCSPLSCLQTR